MWRYRNFSKETRQFLIKKENMEKERMRAAIYEFNFSERYSIKKRSNVIRNQVDGMIIYLKHEESQRQEPTADEACWKLHLNRQRSGNNWISFLPSQPRQIFTVNWSELSDTNEVSFYSCFCCDVQIVPHYWKINEFLPQLLLINTTLRHRFQFMRSSSVG